MLLGDVRIGLEVDGVTSVDSVLSPVDKLVNRLFLIGGLNLIDRFEDALTACFNGGGLGALLILAAIWVLTARPSVVVSGVLVWAGMAVLLMGEVTAELGAMTALIAPPLELMVIQQGIFEASNDWVSFGSLPIQFGTISFYTPRPGTPYLMIQTSTP
ncbi:hypothetical protein [Natronorubrum texcoconense]|uniref:hypothetical protein n=1 Tax=Natronorubrum texcoconense TaxID=1095776 RepID=UPI000B7F7FCC|nr:hypothetical protein [Natronorubrum texcoconense]